MAFKLATLANMTTFAEDALKVFATKTELAALSAAAVKTVKVNGEVVAAQDGAVNITAATGSANGTIAVAGTDVAVKGLGAMAYLDEIGADQLAEAVTSKIDANAAAIEVLNGEATVEGSVKKTVAGEVAKIVGGASEDFDTLKEMEDWLSGHESDAAAMNSSIQGNSAALTHIYKQLGVATDAAAPAEGKDVVGRIGSLETDVAGLKTDLSGYVKSEDIEVIDDATIHALLGLNADGTVPAA